MEINLTTPPEKLQNIPLEDLSELIFKDPQRAHAELKKYLQASTSDQGFYEYIQCKAILAFLTQHTDQSTEAKKMYEELLPQFEDSGDIHAHSQILIDYSGILLSESAIEESRLILERAHRLIRVYPDVQLQARQFCRMGYLHLQNSSLEQAFQQFIAADRLFNQIHQPQLKDVFYQSMNHTGMGLLYEQIGNLDQWLSEHQKAFELCESNHIILKRDWRYYHLGNAAFTSQNFSLAFQYYQKLISFQADANSSVLAGACANLGYCYLKNDQFEAAESCFSKAEALYMNAPQDSRTNLTVIENWRALLCAKKGLKAEAKQHFENAVEFAKQINDHKQLSAICKDIAVFYESLNDYRNAYEFLKLHQEIGEMHQQNVPNQQLLELQIKYQFEKNEQEKELLQLKMYGLQHKALRAQMNPHFQFNGLNAIQSKIQQKKTEEAVEYLGEFSKLMRMSLDHSEKECISLEDEIEFLKIYLYLNKKLRYDDVIDYELVIDDDLEDDIMGVPSMIIQPFIENAIEHGIRNVKNGIVKIHFSLFDDDTIKCTIEDNGVGRKKAAEIQYNRPQHTSMATDITKRRLELLNHGNSNKAKIEIIDLYHEETGEARGTRVEIFLPIMEIHVQGGHSDFEDDE